MIYCTSLAVIFNPFDSLKLAKADLLFWLNTVTKQDFKYWECIFLNFSMFIWRVYPNFINTH